MAVYRLIWFVSLLTCGGGSTLYNAVKTDYEAFLAAYQDTSNSGRSISAEQIIPKDTTAAPLTVYLNMALYAIMDFDAVEGTMEIVGSINLQWTDEVKTLKGVTFTSTAPTLFFTPDQIWTPNLVLMNAVDSIENIGDDTYKIRYNTSSGDCQWNPRVLILAACTPDPTFFPFDDQTCTLSIKPVGHASSLIILEVTSDQWDTSDLQESSIWTLAETKSSAGLSGGTYMAEFKVTIKRKPLFMTIVIVLPVLLLSLLSGFLFLLPPGSGERVGFGITSFLSFVVLLQTLMQLLPDSSDPMSLLCYYVILMLTLTAVLSIVNIFLLRIYISPGKDKVPRGFIYFYKTIKCRPCRACYVKTKTKLRPPCRTAVDKMKTTATRLYTFVRSIRCQDCRKLLLARDKARIQDRVLNKRFSKARLQPTKRTSGMSVIAVEMAANLDAAVEREGMSIRSRKMLSSNSFCIDTHSRDSIETSQIISRNSAINQTTRSQIANIEKFDTNPSLSVSTNPSFHISGEVSTTRDRGDDESISPEKRLTPNGITTDAVIEHQEQALVIQQVSDVKLKKTNSQLTFVEEVETVDEESAISSTLPDTVAETLGGIQNTPGIANPSSDISSGYNSQQSDDVMFGSSQTIPLKIRRVSSLGKDLAEVVVATKGDIEDESQKHLEGKGRMSQNALITTRSAHALGRCLTEDDFAVMSDGERSDNESEEEDEDWRLLSDLTWEFVGQILDYFFIVTFIALQTTFTIFFIVPLGARSA